MNNIGSITKIAARIGAILTAIYTTAFLFAGRIYADALSDRIDDVTDSRNEDDLVSSILRLAVPLAITALVALFVFAGYQMLTSQGNPDKLNEARETITNAVLGFLLIALSVAILVLIQNVLQIPGVNP
ncbi:MAG: hypothetical protein QY318_02530 [Candidatus Dojkabacteria bacterium]|nr:MAG: hypothetical protein QY318_02530 [Candidatus Dojkabacteria bacterium]